MDQILSILKEIPIFHQIEESHILELVRKLDGHVKICQRDEIIYPFGEQIRAAGVILDGSINVIMHNSIGSELDVKQLHKGQLIGSAYALVPSETSTVQVLAHKKSQILFLNLTLLYSPEMLSNPYATLMLRNLLTETARNNIYQNKKIQILSQKHIRDKVLLYLRNLPKRENRITLPLNRQELANHLGVDRSALSRELCKMKQDGLIDFHKNEIQLLKNISES